MDIIISAAILGPLITGLILFQIHRYNAFKSASDKFRSAVLKELEGLYPIPSNWPTGAFHIGKVLTDKFKVLQSVVETFRDYLPWYKRSSFDIAWFKYYYYNAYATEPASDKNKSEQCYHHYMDYSEMPDPKETFKHNVDALLKFAKQK